MPPFYNSCACFDDTWRLLSLSPVKPSAWISGSFLSMLLTSWVSVNGQSFFCLYTTHRLKQTIILSRDCWASWFANIAQQSSDSSLHLTSNHNSHFYQWTRLLVSARQGTHVTTQTDMLFIVFFLYRGDVVKALNEAIDKREEGLVIKTPSSVYKPNLRSGTQTFGCLYDTKHKVATHSRIVFVFYL